MTSTPKTEELGKTAQQVHETRAELEEAKKKVEESAGTPTSVTFKEKLTGAQAKTEYPMGEA
jgi:hypothetical protein